MSAGDILVDQWTNADQDSPSAHCGPIVLHWQPPGKAHRMPCGKRLCNSLDMWYSLWNTLEA